MHKPHRGRRVEGQRQGGRQIEVKARRHKVQFLVFLVKHFVAMVSLENKEPETVSYTLLRILYYFSLESACDVCVLSGKGGGDPDLLIHLCNWRQPLP